MKLSSAVLLSLLMVAPICSGAQSFAERNPEYVLQRGDVLDIRYRYTPEFNQIVTVRPDDRATLLHLSTIVTAGMTVSQFKDAVTTLSSKLLVNPDITVILKEFEKPRVYVEGEVNTPGRVEIRSDTSILDAIALAGGFKTSAAQGKVLLVHRAGTDAQAKTTELDLAKLVKNKKLEEAVLVRPGDVIYVTQNSLSKIERIAHMGQFGAIYNPLR